jgi:hypothetical protein
VNTFLVVRYAMLGKNLLWVAKQHGHSVEVMLRMYAAWIEGATDADIQMIQQAMDPRPLTFRGVSPLPSCFFSSRVTTV